LLQLGGFLLASVFGGFLLDQVVGGKVAERFISLFVGFADRLRKLMQKLAKAIITVKEPEEPVWLLLVLCCFWIVSLTALIIGWLEHISVLLWTGVGLYSVYAMFFLVLPPALIFVPWIQKVFRVRLVAVRNGQELSAKEFFPDYALVAAVAVSGIAWLVLLALLFLSYFFTVSSSTMKMLANPRVPKAAFTVLGYLMLLAGLIIDAIAAF
jgi:predicted RND superfamily exporter protein